MNNSFLKRRLTQLEVKKNISPPKYRLWVSDAAGGLLRNSDGRTMTREAFDKAFPNAKKFRLNIFDSNRD